MIESSKVNLLKKYIDEEKKKLFKYSGNYLMSRPSSCYEKEWNETKNKIEFLEEIANLFEREDNVANTAKQDFFQQKAEEAFKDIDEASRKKVDMLANKQNNDLKSKKFSISKIKRVFHSTEVPLVNEKLGNGWHLLAFTNINNRVEYALGYIEY